MSANEIHVGDIGTVLTVTVQDGDNVVDISGATTKQIILTDPSGNAEAKNGTFVTDGTDGQMKYTTVVDDLDEAGKWNLQAYVVLPSGSWKSDISRFQVHGNLS